MSKKFLITLNNDQMSALMGIMAEDMQHNRSAYIGLLIAQEVKRREEAKNKKGAGRPRKEDEPEDENLYPHPANKELAVTVDEWEGYYKLNNLPMPELPAPIGKRN